jgi:hypothetical protein
MTAACAYCGRPVDPSSRYTWHLVTGWARRGKAGGSDIACRTPASPSQMACDVCVRRVQAGVSPAQGTLL